MSGGEREPGDTEGAVPEGVRRLAAEREERRRAGDFDAADALRDRIGAAGYEVADEPSGPRLVPRRPARPRVAPAAVGSVLDRPADRDASIHWLVEHWPEDVRRGVASFSRAAPGRRVQHVVVDTRGGDLGELPDDVEVVALDRDPGWAAAVNAGLGRSLGRIAVVADGSIEAVGDWLGPVEAALADPTVAVVGPVGLVTDDLRTFRESRGPEVDAVAGHLMAFRREVVARVGGFDEGFRFYRIADVEWSFRARATGMRALVVPLPVVVHRHRTWEATPPEERERLSRRNFRRFLDGFRDRFDLTVGGGHGGPPGRPPRPRPPVTGSGRG